MRRRKNRQGSEPLPYIGDGKKSSDVGRMLRHAPKESRQNQGAGSVLRRRKISSGDRAPTLHRRRKNRQM